MIVNPMLFTYEQLSSLKFKELQKLSVQYQVNKRWAKKQELIENLLALKSTLTDKPEEKEWKDGSMVFNNLPMNTSNENRRLTFNITTNSAENATDSRSTFEIPQNGKTLLNSNEKAVNSRETYDIPPTKEEFGVEPLVDSRATFEIAPKENILKDSDSRATFDIPQNESKILENVQNEIEMSSKGKKERKTTDVISILKKDSEKLTSNLDKSKIDDKVQVKMLTIPYARITRRTRTNGENSKNVESPIKMSKKSINIKKTTRQPANKLDLIKSPALSSLRKPVNKQMIMQSLSNAQPVKTTQSKLPTKLQFKEEKPSDNNKENVKKILRRKSNTADEVLVKKSTTNKVSFMSPPVSIKKTSKLSIPLRKTPMKREFQSKTGGKIDSNCHTPSMKSASTSKPITATKMPDFNKIHQKQFQQMDSLHDYFKKKEERKRRLFGTPQPPSQNKVVDSTTKSTQKFNFQFTIGRKSDPKAKANEKSGNATTPLKKKILQKETFKSKLPPMGLQTDIKDKNRSHIHGVRTNKRFELQMKFRNM